MPTSSEHSYFETPRTLRSRLGGAALIVGVWLVLGIFQGVQSHLNTLNSGHPVPLWSAVGIAVQRYLVYALLTFPLLGLCRRFPLTSKRWLSGVAAHMIGLAGFVVLYAALRIVTGSVRNAQTLEPLPPTLDNALTLMRSSFFEQFWMYGSMVAVIVALEHYRQARRRELREAGLKQQVAEYRLQVLRLQLHPHFLFNALNGIATLMLRDVRTAREMLLRLGDLLRIALTHSADHETSLREEVEFVRAYLDLERMRFGERLVVHLAIEPDSLDARVPYMILQPLVENAIRHGIAEVRAGGTLSLLTACRAGRLHIRIVNDGPRLAPAPDRPLWRDSDPGGPLESDSDPGTPRGAGIGLKNARARLSQLYGDAYRLRLVERPEGGAELHMELPLRGAAEAAGAEAATEAAGPAGDQGAAETARPRKVSA